MTLRLTLRLAESSAWRRKSRGGSPKRGDAATTSPTGEEHIARCKAYYRAHIDKWKQYHVSITDEECELVRERARQYYRDHREERIAYAKRWRAEHPDKVRMYYERELRNKRLKREKMKALKDGSNE